jgi:hypothetical protein
MYRMSGQHANGEHKRGGVYATEEEALANKMDGWVDTIAIKWMG